MGIWKRLFGRENPKPPAYTFAEFFAAISDEFKDDFYVQCCTGKLNLKVIEITGFSDWQELELTEERARRLIPLLVAQVLMEIQDCQALFQYVDRPTSEARTLDLEKKGAILLLSAMLAFKRHLGSSLKEVTTKAQAEIAELSDAQFKRHFGEMLENFRRSLS